MICVIFIFKTIVSMKYRKIRYQIHIITVYSRNRQAYRMVSSRTRHGHTSKLVFYHDVTGLIDERFFVISLGLLELSKERF